MKKGQCKPSCHTLAFFKEGVTGVGGTRVFRLILEIDDGDDSIATIFSIAHIVEIIHKDAKELVGILDIVAWPARRRYGHLPNGIG